MAEDILTKTCRVCEETKSLTEFPWRNAKRISHRAECFVCFRASARERRAQQVDLHGFADAPKNDQRIKTCSQCDETKPVSEFHWRRDWQRYRAECKDCYRKTVTARRDPEDNRRRVKEWQKANPEKKRSQAKRSYESRRVDVVRWMNWNLRSLRASCKKRNLKCTLTDMDIMMIYNIQNGKCALTGRVLIYGSKGQQRDSISIDRINPSQGYVPSNVRLVTYQANFARNKFSDDDLFAFCEAVLATRDAQLMMAAE